MTERDTDLILDCTDCIGRRVVLELFNWENKILLKHWEAMEQNWLAIETTICRPDFINHDSDYGDREVYYRRGLLPAPYDNDYVKVVVVIEHTWTFRTHGRVISAYETSNVKKGEKKKWPKRKERR